MAYIMSSLALGAASFKVSRTSGRLMSVSIELGMKCFPKIETFSSIEIINEC